METTDTEAAQPARNKFTEMFKGHGRLWLAVAIAILAAAQVGLLMAFDDALVWLAPILAGAAAGALVLLLAGREKRLAVIAVTGMGVMLAIAPTVWAVDGLKHRDAAADHRGFPGEPGDGPGRGPGGGPSAGMAPGRSMAPGGPTGEMPGGGPGGAPGGALGQAPGGTKSQQRRSDSGDQAQNGSQLDSGSDNG